LILTWDFWYTGWKMTEVSPNASVFPRQYYSPNVSYSSFYLGHYTNKRNLQRR